MNIEIYNDDETRETTVSIRYKEEDAERVREYLTLLFFIETHKKENELYDPTYNPHN